MATVPAVPDSIPRRQTLRALIDWSYDPARPIAGALFRRLGIFVNVFTLEGAAAVAGGDDLDELDAFDGPASVLLISPSAAAPPAVVFKARRSCALKPVG